MIRMLISIVAVSTLLLNCQHSKKNDGNPEKAITTIAFGSCSYQDSDEQLWDEINDENPELMILLGDNIYGDTHNMDEMQLKYQQQKSRASYQNLIQSTKVIGVWDDHDYGINDGGKFFSKKDSSKLLMLDFLDVPAEAPIRTRNGAYSAHTLSHNKHTVKVILLDTRYFRDTLAIDTTSQKRYLINPDGDILGDQQWAWLKQELEESTADVNLIASSIQVIAEQHGFEKWGNFPNARNKLLQLIGETSPSNTVIISGDRHIAELSAMEIDGLNYSLYDFTASGLTHTWNEPWEEENSFRVGELIREKNYGLVTINWDEGEITLEVKGGNGESFLTHRINLN